MDCYQHTGVPAAALCKAWGKGVCRRCAIEIPYGIACSPACETFARTLVELQQQSIKSIGQIRTTRLMQPLMATSFIAFGSYMYSRGGFDPMPLMFILLGGSILATWAWSHWRKRDG